MMVRKLDMLFGGVRNVSGRMFSCQLCSVTRCGQTALPTGRGCRLCMHGGRVILRHDVTERVASGERCMRQVLRNGTERFYLDIRTAGGILARDTRGIGGVR